MASGRGQLGPPCRFPPDRAQNFCSPQSCDSSSGHACPCRYDRAYEFYKKAQASYWTVEEVDLSQDYRDWQRLTRARLAESPLMHPSC